jgi:hypothetical protein
MQLISQWKLSQSIFVPGVVDTEGVQLRTVPALIVLL